MKFIVDCMLGRLAKWLRMLGYDTSYIHGASDDELIRTAVREDRILLTRDHLLAERRIIRNRCVFIDSLKTAEQVRQIIDALSLESPGEKIFTRCVLCNGEIHQVSKQTVKSEVPPYVYRTQNEFGRCTSCGKVYWKGTHIQHVLQALGYLNIDNANQRRQVSVLDAIKNRRSVRSYRPNALSEEDIQDILLAAFSAPSAHGKRPWHIVVVTEPEVRALLAETHEWSKFILQAPVALVVCVDRSVSDTFWVEDASAAMENILIAAASKGLGTCWIGIHGAVYNNIDSEEKVRKILGVPDNIGILAITPLGYPADTPEPREPQIPEGRVHYNRFGSH